MAMTNRIERKFIGKSQAVLVAFVAIVGCSNPVANIPELKPEQLVAKPVKQPAYEQNYKMVPYDLITIRFPFHPEQDPKAPVSIRPDGQINLDGVGSVQAAVLTPDELGKQIAAKTSTRLRKPEVMVAITQCEPRKTYGVGQDKNTSKCLVHSE